jgi:hypothetical protein
MTEVTESASSIFPDYASDSVPPAGNRVGFQQITWHLFNVI